MGTPSMNGTVMVFFSKADRFAILAWGAELSERLDLALGSPGLGESGWLGGRVK